MKNRARAVLGAVSSIHFLHDGFSETLYVFLPLWAREFGLTFAQVGLIRSAYTGGMSAFQIPAGFLAERWGERRLLAAGTAVTAIGFIVAGWAGGFVPLLLLLLAAGLGSGVQHPLSSSLVSKAYETGNRRTALGTWPASTAGARPALPSASSASSPRWPSCPCSRGSEPATPSPARPPGSRAPPAGASATAVASPRSAPSGWSTTPPGPASSRSCRSS